MENLFKCKAIVRYHIATKFCTYHNSTSVMPCAKFHSDHFTITWMGAEWNFHRNWIMIKKLFMKWAPGLPYIWCVILDSIISKLLYCVCFKHTGSGHLTNNMMSLSDKPLFILVCEDINRCRFIGFFIWNKDDFIWKVCHKSFILSIQNTTPYI